MANKLAFESYWEKLSIKSYIDNIFDQQMRLTSGVIKHAIEAKQIDSCSNAIEGWKEKNAKQIDCFNSLIEDIKPHESPDFAMLTVAGQRLKDISR